MGTEDLGQADADSGTTTMDSGTTSETPEIDGNTQQTSQSAPVAEETFFDYNSIKGNPELEAAYKQMQSAFTKKNQSIAQAREKIEAYDNFMQNPQASLQQLMQQYGINPQAQQAQPQEFNPSSWDDVMSHMKQQVLQELQPVFNEVQSVKKQNIEAQMDNNFPDWRTYEDEMRDNLQKHPSLAQDPGLLYRMSVPQNILESRATQAALKKLQGQNSNAQVSGGGKTNRQPTSIKKAGSFNEAFEMAKQQLIDRGG